MHKMVWSGKSLGGREKRHMATGVFFIGDNIGLTLYGNEEEGQM